MRDDSITIGGQAVIEGVMMRSPELVVTSVRKPSGEIVSRAEPYVSVTKKHRILGIPVIRGAIALFETLYLGIRSLSYSAEVASEEEKKEKKHEKGAGAAHEARAATPPGAAPGTAGAGALAARGADSGTSSEQAPAARGADGGTTGTAEKAAGGWKSSLTMGATLVLALGLGLLLFFWLPLVIADQVGVKGSILYNVVDGLVRLAIFFLYLGVISLWRDMRRVFEYHGAEHKSINSFESGEELTLENARRQTTRHRRCGTSFLLIVMVIAIIVFIFMGRPDSITDRLRRFAVVPLIAGLSYELTRLAGRRSCSTLMKIMTAPGMLLQRFTTREPADDQIEVALDALKRSLRMEAGGRHVGSNRESS